MTLFVQSNPFDPTAGVHIRCPPSPGLTSGQGSLPLPTAIASNADNDDDDVGDDIVLTSGERILILKSG